MRSFFQILLICSIFTVGCGTKSKAIGQYRFDQIMPIPGAAPNKMVLDLREDKSFVITVGHAKVFEGTWSEPGNDIELSSAEISFGTKYHRKDRNLVPFAYGNEIPSWRWAHR